MDNIRNSDLDYQLLEREMDIVRTKVFLGSNAAFLASIMSSMNFVWTSDIPTAQVNGLTLEWNPYWFLKLPPRTRRTVLLHELWHVAFLHMLRRGDRHPLLWNWACDVVINNQLEAEGETFEGTKPWKEKKYGILCAEEIYDMMLNDPKTMAELEAETMGLWGEGDVEEGTGQAGDLVEPEGTPEEIEAQINKTTSVVVGASHTASMIGAGTPSEVSTILKRFLQPKIPWEVHIHKWMQDLADNDYYWGRPNRRYQDMYLPSLREDVGRLEHLIWFMDVSGSVSDKDVIRMNSEVKYVKETYNPAKLSIVLFDDCIQQVIVMTDTDEFDEIVITGRGGTDLTPVREYVIENQATAAVVFSDMQCAPMEPLPADKEVPILWIGVNASKQHQIKMGKIIYIRE